MLHKSVLGDLYWKGGVVGSPFFELNVDWRLHEIRPQQWSVVRSDDSSIYLRFRGYVEALIIPENRNFLNRTELCLISIPEVSSLHWIDHGVVSVFFNYDRPVRSPDNFLRAMTRKINSALDFVPIQMAASLEEIDKAAKEKLWGVGSGAYYCEGAKGVIGERGHAASVFCEHVGIGVEDHLEVQKIELDDAVGLQGFVIANTGITVAPLVVATTNGTAYLVRKPEEFKPVTESEQLKRVSIVWSKIRNRAKGDQSYWFRFKTFRTFGFTTTYQAILTEADEFIKKMTEKE